MPGIRLECSEQDDWTSLIAVAPVIHEYLSIATTEALKLKDGPAGVSLKLIFAPGVNIPRVDVYAEVSEKKTPEPQDMDVWRRALRRAWVDMRNDGRLMSVRSIMYDLIGFWTGKRMGGTYEELLPKQ